MNVEINQSNTKVNLSFQFSWEEVKPFLEKSAKELSDNLDISGFRKGNVPVDVVKNKVGEKKLLNRAVELLINDKYPQVVQEKGLDIVSQPEVQIKKLAWENDIEVEVNAQVLPDVDLPDYKSLVKQVEEQELEEVSEEEVEQALKQIQKSRADFKQIQRACKEGDFVEISYKSPQIENGKQYQDGFILGDGNFIEGFENNVEGMKTGEDKKFMVVFPQDKQESPFLPDEKVKKLQGEQVEFEVKMKSVKEIEEPELNDEFAQKLGQFDNLKQLKENVKNGIQKEKTNKQKQQRRSEMLEKITSKIDVKIPPTLLEKEKKNMLADLKQKVQSNLNMSFEKYLEKTGKEEEEVKEEFEEKAEQKIKNYLILQKIGKKEGVEVTDEEIDKAVEQFLSQSPDKQSKNFDKDRLREYYRGAIFNQNVMEKLEELSNE